MSKVGLYQYVKQMGPKLTTRRSENNFMVPFYDMRPGSVVGLILNQRTENFG